jgi:hypothetical protein
MLMEEYRLGPCNNRVMRITFGPGREEVTAVNCVMRSFLICTFDEILSG